MTRNRLLSLLLAAVMVFTAFGFVAVEQTSAASDYTFDVDTGTITKYTGSETVVNIPEEIAGYTVKKIGSSCFAKTKITEVIIPNTVTEIGNSAFQECEYLQKVYIPYSVESIGYMAFYMCTSLKQVIIPSSVTEFKSFNISLTRTFAGCTSLVSVIFQANVKEIPSCFCEGCTALKYVEFSDSVTSIGERAFCECKSLVSVEFPASIETIGEYAFYECTSLKNIYIPNTVSKVDDYAFANCIMLKTAILNGESFGAGAFFGCTFLGDVKIMENTKSLRSLLNREGVFAECPSLTNIEIPSNVVRIESGTFYNHFSYLTIYCEQGSEAMKFALAQGINYSFDEAPYFDNTPEKPVLTKDIDVSVNEKYLYFDQAPVLQNSRVLVPIRAIAEALGAEVTWDSATSTAIVELDGSTVKIQLGNNIMTKDGSEITLDVPANMISNRILVPVRAVSEAFGCSVEWDGDTKTVFITQ